MIQVRNAEWRDALMSLFKDLFRSHGSPKNTALERAMHELARHDNEKTRKALYEAILASTFILQGDVSGGREVRQGKWIADSNTRVAFRTVEHPPGTIVLPTFTSVEALASWAGPGVPWVALPARQLFQSIAPGDIKEVRVNPFQPGQTISRPGGIITRNEFTALAQGLLPMANVSNIAQMKVAAGQKLLIGRPTQEPPAEVLLRLTNYFQNVQELRGAYLFQMTNQTVNSSVVGLHFDAAPNAELMQQIVGGIGQMIQGAIPEDASIDFMPLTPGPFLDSVQKCGKTLIKKSLLLCQAKPGQP